MGENLTGKKDRKTNKVVGVLIGLSLVQTGTVLVPGGNLTMTVYAGDEMTTEEYAQAAAEALEQLSTGSDKSALNEMISKAEKLDVSSSDDASVAQLNAVLAAAKQVSADGSVSQSMVDKLIQLLQASGNALYQKTDANTVYDGVYELNGSLQHASADQVSMGNAALVKPFQLIKDGDSLKLRIECVPLTAKLGTTDFTGYLAEFWYFPDWTDEVLPPSAYTTVQSADAGEAETTEVEETQDAGGEEAGKAEDAGEAEDSGEDGGDLFSDSADETAAADASGIQEEVALYAGSVGGIAATVESTYDGYDSYNDPNTGTDANVKGKLYPHYITIPIELNRSLLWTQVYVPVMETIGGGGRQYARLCLDWSTLKQISGTTTDKSKLASGISEAETLLAGLNNDNQGYAAEQIQALTQVIAAAKAVNSNMNVDQEIVDNETTVLTRAVNVFTKTVVDSDKTELKKAIEVADTYLKADDITYDPETLAILQEARDKAQLIYDDEEASQTQVNLCVTAIDNAIQGLVVVGGDRRELKKVMATAAEMLEDEDSYSVSTYNRLQSAYNDAKTVMGKEDAEQTEIDNCVKALNTAIKNMKKVAEVKVDKSSLYEMLKTAQNMSGREDTYTADTIKALKSAITEAEKVYKNDEATQSEVNAQTSALSTAITNLTKQTNSSNNNSNSSNNTSGNDDVNISGDDDNDNSLDINNLEDGVYSVTGSMVKIDKSTASMSNEAINHTIKLTVKNGKYSLTMDFKGMTINNQYGYLGKLKYYKSGYTLDKYGSPQGSLGSVTIDSYQKYSDGKKVSDNFGTDYPDVVTFPMISEALKDGYVPLQVFVPIMDSISKGTGTQPVFLKLDWSTIKKTSSSDSAFNDTSTNEKTSGSGTTTTGGLSNTLQTGGSSLTTNGSLTTGSKLGTSSLTTGSSLSAGSSSLKKSGTTSLTSSKNLTSTSKDGKTSTTALKSTAAGASADGTSSKGSGTAKKSAEDVAKVAIPSVLSSLAALAGIFYKLKSRIIK